MAHHKPATDEETNLVEAIANSIWRLDRIQQLEFAIYSKGRIEFADKFQDQPEAHRPSFIQLETYLKYEKSIKNLNTQEARLRRVLEKDQLELKRLQTLRKRIEQAIAASPSAQMGSDFQPAAITHPASVQSAPAAPLTAESAMTMS